MEKSTEEKGRRAERERERRQRMKEAGIKVERSPDYKRHAAERERERRKTPEAKQQELEWRRRNREENRERYRAYSREFQRKRRADLKALGLSDPHGPTAEYLRAYRARDPIGYAFSQRARKYGIPVEDQKVMIAQQNNRCANIACLAELVGRTMQLDHCHRTGKVRAFLCGHCNAALGRMGDDPAKIRGLAEYIERF